jgi:hypothetical protein
MWFTAWRGSRLTDATNPAAGQEPSEAAPKAPESPLARPQCPFLNLLVRTSPRRVNQQL